jgi:hypothetical protein
MIHSRRMLALLLSFVTSATFVAAPALAASPQVQRVSSKAVRPLKIIDKFVTKDGRNVTLVGGDIAIVKSPHKTLTVRYLSDVAMDTHGIFRPDRAEEVAALNKPPTPAHPYVNGVVLVVLRSGTGLPNTLSVSRGDLAAKRTYSGDSALNSALAQLGVTHVRRLLTSLGESRLEAMRAQARNASTLLPLENTYVMQITHGTVSAAVTRLRSVNSVLAAEPNFYLSSTIAHPRRMKKAQLAHATMVARSGHDRETMLGERSFSATQSSIPNNYAVAYSAQSSLNAPGVNSIAAYDEIERHFHQLPGSGEIITNVSVGDVVDATTLYDESNTVCSNYDQYLIDQGDVIVPTVAMIGGQHYLELPSLPLIPAYVSDDNGGVSGSGSACGEDPYLEEVGLDFSVMAALPHQLQQSGEVGSGYSDLLGIAPGASYRLVVPGTTASFIPTIAQGPTNADLIGALLGAAEQTPAPNVINMSLGFGFDAYGFPSRFLEEDPALQAAVSYVVAKGIVVTIAAGDGLRMYTNSSVGPSGGTVPLNTVASGGTNIFDDEFSTIPSQVIDSGAIAVGGTTLDDIMSAPPDQPQFAKYRDQLTFPETRWNGMGEFASTYGTRLNISAPSDNILTNDILGTSSNGGTSAAAPMVAAGAAIALQVARLAGKPLKPADVRAFLASTARPVPNVLQADMPITVGPQLDVANAVETLLHDGHVTLHPTLNRVAIAQRYPQESEFTFTTDTDPTNIDLTDAVAEENDIPGQAGSSAYQPITIAPDWEELPAGTKFRVYVQGNSHKVLGTAPWVRVFPQELLAATNQPFFSTQLRTVNLEYQAYSGFRVLASASVALTFAPNNRVLQGVGPAPIVPSVVTGKTIPVQYDISAVDPSFLNQPALIVSFPGRTSTWTSALPGYKAAYSVPITQPKGTIEVPVSALDGGGIYGIAIKLNTWPNILGDYDGALGADAPVTTTTAYTRVATTDSRPPAPILSYQGDANFPQESGHAIDVSYNQPFHVNWDVSNIKGATGATLEISAAGPSVYGNYNVFNNPNGSELDADGTDTGSTYKTNLGGTRGSALVSPWPLMDASEYYTLRVLATSSGGQVIGEAGAVSTIETHGVMPSDGGSLLGGFAVNQGATEGILTSNQLDSTNRVDTSVEIFDPQSTAVNFSLAWASTDAGSYSGGASVPVYMLNGYGMDSGGNAYFGLNKEQWNEYPGAFFPTLEYAPHPQQIPSDPLESCDDCFNLPAYGAEASYQNSDYLLGSQGITPVTFAASSVVPGLGTPIPLPGPATGSSACGGLATGEGMAYSATGSDNSVSLQGVSVWNGGQTIASVPALTGVIPTTCNVSYYNGSFAALAENASTGEGVLYWTPTIGGSLAQSPIWGYVPVTLTQLTGNQVGGWAVMSALSLDYLSNNNATSTLSLMDQNYNYVWYARFGNVDNIPIAYNNRLSATGPGGVIYTIGADGNEIAPFLTGL